MAQHVSSGTPLMSGVPLETCWAFKKL